jgi:hypothetical protein
LEARIRGGVLVVPCHEHENQDEAIARHCAKNGVCADDFDLIVILVLFDDPIGANCP